MSVQRQHVRSGAAPNRLTEVDVPTAVARNSVGKSSLGQIPITMTPNEIRATTAPAPPVPSPWATTAAYTTSPYPSVCRGNHVIVLIDDLDIRVLDHTTGQLIRTLTLDYQALGVKCGNSPENQLPT
jgi:hypothetical protein